MDIGLFFKYGDLFVQLPVNPEELEVASATEPTKVNIIALGERSIPNRVKLRSLEFETILPFHRNFSFVRTANQFKPPQFYKDFFQGIMEKGDTVRFVVTGINLTMDVTIEDFTYTHKGGDSEDAYIKMKLLESKPYGIVKVPVSQYTDAVLPVKKPSPKPPAVPSKPKKITVGCDVICTGTVYFSSYGARPTLALKNFRGKINMINLKGSFPYHVTTPQGGNRGWTTADKLKLV